MSSQDPQQIMKEVSHGGSDEPTEPLPTIEGRLRAVVQAARVLHDYTLPERSAMNAQAPISKLPFELLSLIFLFYIHDPELRTSESQEPSADPHPASTIRWTDIMRIVRVCHTWRSVALNCPELWSQIIFSPTMEAMETMLERSGTSPLYIRWLQSSNPARTRDSPIANVKRITGINVDRIRELHLDLAPYASATHTLLSRICHTSRGISKQLRSVYIRGDMEPWYRHGTGLSTFFLVWMPNLQHLELIDVNIQWEILHDAAMRSGFPSLLSVKLTTADYFQPEPDDFYDMLAGMPILELLYLKSVLPYGTFSTGPAEQASGPLISLPNLSSLTVISSPLSSCVEFHKTVSYPVTKATLRFHLDTTNTAEESPGFVRTLLRICGLSEGKPRRCYSNLFISSTSGSGINRIKAVLWDGGDDTFPQRLHTFDYEQPSVVLDFTSSHWRGPRDGLDGSLSIQGLRRVGIDMHARWPDSPTYMREEWNSFFKRHPDVEHLHILADRAPEIITSLSLVQPRSLQPEQRATSSTWSQASKAPPLPKLRSITLEDRIFVPKGYHPSEDEGALDLDLHARNKIAACVSMRHDHGLRLQKLHLLSAEGWSPWVVEELNELVAGITWTDTVPESFRSFRL